MKESSVGPSRRPNEADTRRASKADQVYTEIKEAILSGELEPGAAIDKIALCGKLGMSRFPVTTAIHRLAYEKLVTIEPQHGSFVARISAAHVQEWMLLRCAIEVEIAGVAAFKMPETLAADLARNMRYQQAAVDASDVDGFYRLDVEFHRLIVNALGYAYAAEILDELHSHLERVRRLLLTPPGRLPITLAQHKSIVDALTQGNRAAAQAAMRLHLEDTTDMFRKVVAQRPDLISA